MPYEELLILSLTANRAEYSQLSAALRAFGSAGNPRRRRVEGRLVRPPKPEDSEIAVVARNRSTELALRGTGPFPLALERRIAVPVGPSDADWPFLLNALRIDADAEQFAASIDAADSFAASRTETAVDYEGASIRCVAHPAEAGRRLVELAAPASNVGPLLRFARRLHDVLPLSMVWPVAEDPATGYSVDPPEVDAEAAVRDTFRAMAASCLAQVVGNRAGVVAGTAEGVHQMRVGIRRLRAILSLFGPILEPIAHAERKAALSDFQKVLGPMREWDVFIAEQLHRLCLQLPDSEALRHARSAAFAEREAAHIAAAGAVQAPGFAAIVLDTAAWLHADESFLPEAEEATGPFAARVLTKQHRKLRKRGRGHMAATPETLHGIRIQAKKLRYAIEFFSDLYPAKKQKRFLKRVKAVQDALGVVNDAAVAAAHVDVLSHRLEAAGVAPALVGEASGLVRGWQLAETEHERGRFAEVWKDYSRLSRFWD